MTTELARKARLCSQIWMSQRAHRFLPSAATTEAARKLRRVLEMLAGLVERPGSSQPTRMNGEFMPTDSSGRRSPLHFLTTKMARRVRWHSQVLMSHIYGSNRSCWEAVWCSWGLLSKLFHPNRLGWSETSTSTTPIRAAELLLCQAYSGGPQKIPIASIRSNDRCPQRVP
jgi:hypothetical protein